SVLGEVELDELLADREKINGILKRIIDERTHPWGIEVSAVEVKDVDLPEMMKRAMARQAEAERERRAKVINAQGELQASETLAPAVRTLGTQPNALQLRYLQTVAEIAAENNSTTIFPLPIELFRPFLQSARGTAPGEGIPGPAPTSTQGTVGSGEARKVLPPEAPETAMPAQEIKDLMNRLRIEAAKGRTEVDE